MKSGAPREGMILVNVLFVVAVAAIVVMLMLTSQDVAIDRTLRLRQAAQAGALARAGEASTIVALRRDAIAAPQVDHPREAWAAVQDREVAIRGGRFSLMIRDDQARFNLNSIGTGNVVAEARLARILATLGLAPELAGPIAGYVRVSGPVSDLEELAVIGLRPDDIATLSALVTALPRDTAINLNTADERLLAIVFDSPVSARLLDSTRRSRGYLTRGDLSALSVSQPAGTGFTSDFYSVDAVVTVGETRQRLLSALARRAGPSGPEVIVYGRQRLAAAPVEMPRRPLPSPRKPGLPA